MPGQFNAGGEWIWDQNRENPWPLPPPLGRSSEPCLDHMSHHGQPCSTPQTANPTRLVAVS